MGLEILIQHPQYLELKDNSPLGGKLLASLLIGRLIHQEVDVTIHEKKTIALISLSILGELNGSADLPGLVCRRIASREVDPFSWRGKIGASRIHSDEVY